MNRRNFLISGSTALAGLFFVSGHPKLFADPHETRMDRRTNGKERDEDSGQYR